LANKKQSFSTPDSHRFSCRALRTYCISITNPKKFIVFFCTSSSKTCCTGHFTAAVGHALYANDQVCLRLMPIAWLVSFTGTHSLCSGIEFRWQSRNHTRVENWQLWFVFGWASFWFSRERERERERSLLNDGELFIWVPHLLILCPCLNWLLVSSQEELGVSVTLLLQNQMPCTQQRKNGGAKLGQKRHDLWLF
jgi:hypothetical protein